MATLKSVIEDRGSVSRIAVHLRCKFIAAGIQHEGIIQDISLRGAFLSSAFMPAPGTNISIKLETPLLNKPLTLEARVVRRDYKILERGSVGAIAVTFNHSSPEFTRLMGKLSMG